MTTSRLAAAGALGLAAWGAVVAGGPLLGLPSPALRAFGAPPGLIAGLPPTASLVEVKGRSLVLRGATARDLYRLGATLVVPAGLPACVQALGGR